MPTPPHLSEHGTLSVPCAPHESEPGHTYRLAQSLRETEEKSTHKRFPADLTRAPVPDRVLDSLDELSGCAVRLCLLMVRASYSWVEDLGKFRASSRWYTPEQIEDQAGGLGMCRESLRRAANELEDRGWIACRKREGCATRYRWALSVPRERYTQIPAPLLHCHQRLSHSALTLLLCVFRATWGWTERDGETVTHKRTAELSTSVLGKMTGLSRPTVRAVQDELRAKSALYARREHEGAAYEYSVDLSFFRAHLQKTYTPSNSRKSSKSHTRAREPNPENAPTKGQSRGRENAYRVTEDWEEEAIRLLSSKPFEMNPAVARDLVIHRAKSVVEGAVKAFRRRGADVANPAAWMYSAIKNLWFGPSIANKTPNVRQSSGSRPIARAFEALAEKQEGWEWDEADEKGGPKSFGGGEASGLDVEPAAGATHSQMCDLIEALGQPPCGWETVEQSGSSPVFVPSKELANWAYFRRDGGNEQFQKAARKVVNLRARHEGRESPLSGD